ncbi:hypothetical protein Tco_1352630 [Tanacetum coccineum]
MHNNIMAAGSRDRPPMLATGRYAQWRSRFLRYIDTRPNEMPYEISFSQVLYSNNGPYPTVPATEDSSELQEIGEEPSDALQQGESLKIPRCQDKLLFGSFGQFTLTMERQLRMAKNANPFTLVATAQYNAQDPIIKHQNIHKSYAPTSKASPPTRSHATTRHKGKETAKPITPPSESASEEDSDPEQAQKDKDMQKNLALIAKYFKKLYKPTNNNLRTSSNTRNKNVDTNPRYKTDNQTGQFGNQRAVNMRRLDDKIGSTLHVMAKIQEQTDYIRNTCAVETGDSNVIPDSPDMCDNDIQNDQNEILSFDEVQGFLMIEQYDYDQHNVSLNETLGLLAQKDIDIQEGLKVKAYEISVVQAKHDELVKQSLLTRSHYEGLVKEKTKESINPNIHMLAPNALQHLTGRPTFANPMYLKKAQYEHPGLYAITQDQSDPATRLIPDREEILTLAEESRSKLNKDFNDSLAFIHELKQEMHADLKYVESLEDELGLYEITELQCLYLHKVMECDCLLQRFARLEKHSISLEIALQECQVQLKKKFEHIVLQSKEKASNVFRKEREQYVEIQDLKAQLQDKNMAISELKKLVEKCKGKSVDTKFDKPSVVRQPNAQRIPKPSVLGKPAPFSDSLERKYFAKKKSVPKTNESEGLSKPVTLQNLPKTAMQAVRNTNVIKPGMYRIASSTTQTRAPQLNQTFRNTNPRASTSTGVAHKTNVSRPQPRSNQMKDKVVPYTSHAKLKKTAVEEHPRISSISNKTKSVTACNDSLNSRTSNANAVCATCGKCMFNSNHDACVSKFLNDVNARTKKPNVVPISTRKSKSQAIKSVATPPKKTVASESTITSSKSYYRMLYKKTSKAWKWWIAQQCPSTYKWVPKTQKKWVPKTQKKWAIEDISHLQLRLHQLASKENIVDLVLPKRKDGENLDKLKEKGDMYILVGYSTKSKGYRVYNKRTRLIVESIHLRFDEIKEMSETYVANNTSGLVPQRQKASDYDNSDPAPELQKSFTDQQYSSSITTGVGSSFGPCTMNFSMMDFSCQKSSSQLIILSTRHTSFNEYSTNIRTTLLQMLMLRKTTLIKQNLPILSVHRYKKLLSLPHAIVEEGIDFDESFAPVARLERPCLCRLCCTTFFSKLSDDMKTALSLIVH